MTALRNITRDFAAQFRLRGSLFSRLLCVALYYAIYEGSRLVGSSQGDSRLRALRVLGRLGFSTRPAFVRTADGLAFELDVLAACWLVTEVLEERTYEQDPAFAPRPGWTVLDVGGHQGLFTVHAGRRVGPSGRVITLEPFPDNAARLRRNVARNGLSNVRVVQAAAADQEGDAELHLTSFVSGGQSLVFSGDAYDGAIKVPLKTVDGVLREFHIDRVDLVKIDVEGAGLLVLEGAAALLAGKPRLVMEVEGGEKEMSAVKRRLQALGYRVASSANILYAASELPDIRGDVLK